GERMLRAHDGGEMRRSLGAGTDRVRLDRLDSPRRQVVAEVVAVDPVQGERGRDQLTEAAPVRHAAVVRAERPRPAFPLAPRVAAGDLPVTDRAREAAPRPSELDGEAALGPLAEIHTRLAGVLNPVAPTDAAPAGQAELPAVAVAALALRWTPPFGEQPEAAPEVGAGDEAPAAVGAGVEHVTAELGQGEEPPATRAEH